MFQEMHPEAIIMNTTFKLIVAALIVTIGLAGSVDGQLENGAAAYERGDYPTALRMWRPVADRGSAIAQFNLGVMYENGQGVARDYAAAARWYRKAADQGYASAQANLGFMYANGEGGPRDYAAADSWYRKAAERAPDRDPVRPLTPEEFIRKNVKAPGDPCFIIQRIKELREQVLAADRAVTEFKAKNANIIAQVPNEAHPTLRGLESSANSLRTLYDAFIQRSSRFGDCQQLPHGGRLP
jgi:TPR repeat protein